MATIKNQDIRKVAQDSGVMLWQIANALGITDGNFSRKLRKELSADEKEHIIDIIKALSKEGK